jgi:hypothetical protein
VVSLKQDLLNEIFDDDSRDMTHVTQLARISAETVKRLSYVNRVIANTSLNSITSLNARIIDDLKTSLEEKITIKSLVKSLFQNGLTKVTRAVAYGDALYNFFNDLDDNLELVSNKHESKHDTLSAVLKDEPNVKRKLHAFIKNHFVPSSQLQKEPGTSVSKFITDNFTKNLTEELLSTDYNTLRHVTRYVLRVLSDTERNINAHVLKRLSSDRDALRGVTKRPSKKKDELKAYVKEVLETFKKPQHRD